MGVASGGGLSEQLSYAGDHFAAEELDGGHSLVMGDATEGVGQVESVEAE